jgi:hypothetical protein
VAGKVGEEKTVFVDEETWRRVVQELGYEPENLKMSRFIPKNQAILVDEESLKQPFFKGYKTTNFFNT